MCPYIDPDDRADLKLHGDTPNNAGELTYCIQQLLKQYLEDHELRYQHLAECLGALEGAKLDLIERVVKPYEKRKREENGDVWPAQMTAEWPSLLQSTSNAGAVIHQQEVTD